jgi:predicted AlkP superfamily pyrophosphatase or phosphodiesterase
MRRVAVLNVVGLSPSVLAATPRLAALARASGGVRTLVPPLPAVTTVAQSTMLTGLPPSGHGVVANGWFDRSLQEVLFWKQSNRLVAGEKVWETARAIEPTFTVANLFWWFNMYSSVDVSVTPRPQYKADGRKIPDCYTHPATLRDRLQAELGPFPLFRFWGPHADLRSTEWIAAAARRVEEWHGPSLSLVYLPHLDYCLQKFGPDDGRSRREFREIDRLVDGLVGFYRERGVRTVIVSEYGIGPVSGAVEPNRILREAGLLAVRDEDGELLDAGASEAFAVCDHQVAHVYLRDGRRVDEVRALLAKAPGVELALAGPDRAAAGLDHPRAGEIVLVSETNRWFAYPYWRPGREPDFARTVDIHRKPGYDPCELFVDPSRPLLRTRIAAKLLARKLGMRAVLDPVPLDPALVRGSHGRVRQPLGLEPVLFGDGLERLDGGPLPMAAVRDAILLAMELR